MDNNYAFSEAVPLLCQSFLKDGGIKEGDINAGDVYAEAVLERDEEMVVGLGYNPYWAIRMGR